MMAVAGAKPNARFHQDHVWSAMEGYLAAGMVLRRAGVLDQSSHRFRRLQAAQRRPASDQERRCLSATWREAQGHDCAVRSHCLQVVSVQLLHSRKGALGCSCLTESLQSHHIQASARFPSHLPFGIISCAAAVRPSEGLEVDTGYEISIAKGM